MKEEIKAKTDENKHMKKKTKCTGNEGEDGPKKRKRIEENNNW